MSNPVEDKDPKKNKSKKKKETEDMVQDEALTLEINKLKEELDEAKDKYLRLFAEFDNYKKRNTRERFELIKTAAQETMSALLPVLDDFERAKKSAEAGSESFSEGVQLVYNKLYTTLHNLGLKVMDTDGVEFDLEFHDAITDIPAPTEDMKGKIIDTIERGYLLNDKIIRHAKVVVGK
ncbi:MAG: nucleotide exchange factor GrpE [Chitinophagales bacterium]|nr:nucleotide exchange factor GrpE [Chitinophagales bacterium]